jgi:predicted phosphate transport protein (TIGR00153 family)
MPLSLLPKERQFFVLFRENAANLMQSTQVLDEMLNSSPETASSSDPETGSSPSSAPERFVPYHHRLRDLEHQGDEVTHRINSELNRTFITPFDREDIYALASAIDDVIDLVDETADVIILDRVESITAEARQMSGILVQIGQELLQAIDKLESRKDMERHWVRIHDFENQADRITRQAIGALFQDGHDPIYIIKWKDVYALLEKTVDRTEDVANILESVTIKNA